MGPGVAIAKKVFWIWMCSRLPVTRTFKGNRNGVRVIGSSKKLEGSKEKEQLLLHSEHFNHIKL